MNKYSDLIIRHKKSVIAVFLVLAAICAALSLGVSVNYNMVDYLPDDAQSTVALGIMRDEFGGELPNARVMISDVTIGQALAYKDQIAATDGVMSVNWLDDVVGRDTLTTTPAEYLNASVLENYYKDGSALYSVAIESGKEEDTVSAIRTLIGEKNAVAGDAVNMGGRTTDVPVTEVLNAMVHIGAGHSFNPGLIDDILG